MISKGQCDKEARMSRLWHSRRPHSPRGRRHRRFPPRPSRGHRGPARHRHEGQRAGLTIIGKALHHLDFEGEAERLRIKVPRSRAVGGGEAMRPGGELLNLARSTARHHDRPYDPSSATSRYWDLFPAMARPHTTPAALRGRWRGRGTYRRRWRCTGTSYRRWRRHPATRRGTAARAR